RINSFAALILLTSFTKKTFDVPGTDTFGDKFGDISIFAPSLTTSLNLTVDAIATGDLSCDDSETASTESPIELIKIASFSSNLLINSYPAFSVPSSSISSLNLSLYAASISSACLTIAINNPCISGADRGSFISTLPSHSGVVKSHQLSIGASL